MMERRHMAGGSETEFDLVVVGAGPAGLMAAITAAERGTRVAVLEYLPDPGRKLLASGAGKCNLTNALDPAGMAARFAVDPRKFTNMGFADEVASDGTGGWCDGGPYNDMRDMPLGKRSYCGVPFDIIDPTRNNGTSIITLASPHAVNFPRAVRNIPVNEKAQRLYFFNSCAWGERAGIMGEYVITYADGEKLHIPLESGVNNGDWWLPPGPSETTRVAAIPTYNYTVYQYRIKYLRVFEWVNPSPGKTISRIDFVSNRQSAIPILLAISGVKTER